MYVAQRFLPSEVTICYVAKGNPLAQEVSQMSNVDPNGIQHLADTAGQIIDAQRPEDLPSLEHRLIAVGWSTHILRERAEQGDEVADAIVSLMVIVASRAPMEQILQELVYLEKRRQTAPNPVAGVPVPPPMVMTSSKAAPQTSGQRPRRASR